MFRDLKEYQEIAKIYTDKVSKPEDLEERRGSSSAELTQKREKLFPATPPQKGMGGGVGNPTNRRGSGAKQRIKPEKKMGNIPVIDGPVNNPEFGKNMSRDEKDLNPKPEIKKPDPKPMSTRDKFKSKFIKKDKGVGFVRRGTPVAQRAENKEKNKMRAQEMAKARMAAKKEGTASPQMSGADRAKAMAKARLAKKAGMSEGVGAIPMVAGGIGKALGAGAAALGAAGMMMQSKKNQDDKGGQGFGGEKPANAEVKGKKKEKKPRLNIGKKASGRDRNFIQGGGYGNTESVEYDAYDLVLEYLLSSEQAATIEEANYVMTEMDAETIQGIVEEQKKTLDEMDMMKMPVVPVLGGLAAGISAVKGAASYLGRKAGERSIKKTEPKKPGLIKIMKDKTDATNKAIEQM